MRISSSTEDTGEGELLEEEQGRPTGETDASDEQEEAPLPPSGAPTAHREQLPPPLGDEGESMSVGQRVARPSSAQALEKDIRAEGVVCGKR